MSKTSNIALIALLLSIVSCNRSIKLADKVPTVDDDEGVEDDSPPTSSPNVGFPLGAVVPFDAAACPPKWTVFSPLAGRTIVGAGSGNTDADGTALTNRTLGASGGREYTTGIPATTDNANDDMPAAHAVLALASINYLTAGPANTTLDGDKADSNMPPFLARLYCKKTDKEETVPDSATVAFAGASCATGWQDDLLAKSRVIFGVGSGNNDTDGAALTTRALNDFGGKEYTNGIPAHTGFATTGAPDPSLVPARVVGSSDTYGSDFPLIALLGSLTESNLPPYVVNKICKRDGTSLTTIESGTVVAFDLSSCPSGWSAYSEGEGRVILGEGSGNTDSSGTPLTTRNLNVTGGWEFTTGPRASVNLGMSDQVNTVDTFAAGSNQLYSTSGSIPNTTLGGDKAESNMPPFYVLLYCKKD